MRLVSIPKWIDLLKAPFMCHSKERVINAWRSAKEQEGFLVSSTAWSFYFIVKWYQEACQQENVVLWLPGYFCDSALSHVKKLGVEFVFYPIDENKHPDWEKCEALLVENPAPHLFVLTHFLGQERPAFTARRFCKRAGALLIEDAAHVLKPVGEIGKHGDFVLYSPHKLLAVPNIAVMLLQKKALPKFNVMQGLWKREVENVRPNSIFLWLVKRLIQKLLPLGRYAINRLPDFDVDPVLSLEAKKHSPAVHPFSLRLLSLYSAKLDDEAHERLEAYKVSLMLIEILIGKHIELTLPKAAPYACVIDSAGPNETLKDVQALRQQGLPCLSWPDLPKAVLAHPRDFPQAHRFRYQSFMLPIADKKTLFRLCRKSLQHNWREKLQGAVGAFRVIDDQQTWEHLFSRIDQSNIIQSWAFGGAKAQFGWRPQRMAFEVQGKTYAIFQVLSRQYGPFTLYRLNRGPLWLTEGRTLEGQASFYSALSKGFSLIKRRVMLLSPELTTTSVYSPVPKLCGFKKLWFLPWASGWLDLSLSEDALRKNLKSNWRNPLNVGEKNELHVEIDSSNKTVAEVIHWYEKFLNERQFSGPSPVFYQTWNASLMQKDRIAALAYHEGVVVAVALLIRHGRSATYMIGYSNQAGRKLNAMNVLLWRGILALKQQGVAYFDVGGISMETQSQLAISKFKQGLSAQEYQLVGTYLCL